MGTLRRENLRNNGVSTSSKCNQESVHSLYEIALLHSDFFYFNQIVLKVIPNNRIPFSLKMSFFQNCLENDD